MRHIYLADIQFKGASKAAQQALTQLHADTREFVVHLDTDVLDAGELPSVNVPGTGGLRFDDARAILQEIVQHKNLLALDIAQYNPDKDPDGSGAKKLVDLLVDVLSARLASQDDAPPAPAPSVAENSAAAVAHPEPAIVPAIVANEPAAPETTSEALAVVEESAAPETAAEVPPAVDEPAAAEVSSVSDTDVDAPEISSSQTSS